MINEVRNTVLALLNKNNNGYLTPEEFNLLAKQAQLEVFEDYFYDYNAWINKQNARQANNGYTDIPRQLVEVIETFSISSSLSSHISVQIDSTGAVTGTFSAGDTVTQAVSGATGVVVSYEVSSTSTIKILRLNTVVGTFNTTGLITGTAGTLASPLTITTGSFFQLPTDWYTLITVVYNNLEVERVSRYKVLNLINSNLTAPTEGYPAYYQNGATPGVEGNSITVYPTSIISGLSVNYIRYPKSPNWTYQSIGSDGAPIFDVTAADYQDFELPTSDYGALVIKILELAGLVIREAAVTQFAQQEEVTDNQQEQ